MTPARFTGAQMAAMGERDYLRLLVWGLLPQLKDQWRLEASSAIVDAVFAEFHLEFAIVP